MLKKELRLLGPISNRSNLISTPQFNLKYFENGLGVSRFAFVISKKVDKRAVVRNRAKRVFRSCIEENLESIKKGYDFLFILKRNIIGKERDDIQSSLMAVLGKNNLT